MKFTKNPRHKQQWKSYLYMGLILKIQLTNPPVWQSNQYLHKSFLPTPKPRSPLEYWVLLFQTLHKHSWTQHRQTEVEKNSQMSVATNGPVAQLAHKQNVARLKPRHQFGGETASSYFLCHRHIHKHTQSLFSPADHCFYKSHQHFVPHILGFLCMPYAPICKNAYIDPFCL